MSLNPSLNKQHLTESDGHVVNFTGMAVNSNWYLVVCVFPSPLWFATNLPQICICKQGSQLPKRKRAVGSSWNQGFSLQSLLQ